MSLVSLMAAKLSSVAMANNAESGWMRSANSIMNGVRQAGSGNLSFGSMQSLHENEKNAQSNMLMSSFKLQVANAQQDMLNKMLKDSIKRNFDTFA